MFATANASPSQRQQVQRQAQQQVQQQVQQQAQQATRSALRVQVLLQAVTSSERTLLILWAALSSTILSRKHTHKLAHRLTRMQEAPRCVGICQGAWPNFWLYVSRQHQKQPPPDSRSRYPHLKLLCCWSLLARPTNCKGCLCAALCHTLDAVLQGTSQCLTTFWGHAHNQAALKQPTDRAMKGIRKPPYLKEASCHKIPTGCRCFFLGTVQCPLACPTEAWSSSS
jgi:hypothetical protein